VVGSPRTYANSLYVLLGLPLGVIALGVIATGLSLGLGLLVVALAGVPVLVGLWHAVHALAGVERRTAAALVRRPVLAPTVTAPTGNLWAQLRALSADRQRRRELGYLLLRIPVGIVTSVTAIALVGAALTVSWAPFERRLHDEPWGDWPFSSDLEAASSSPWSWLLVPAGLLLLVAALHAVDAMAVATGRWAARRLSPSPSGPAGTTGTPAPGAAVRLHAAGFAVVAAVLVVVDLATGTGWWSRWPLVAGAAVLGFHAALSRRRPAWAPPWHGAALDVHVVGFASVVAMLVAFDVVGGAGWWSHWPLVAWAPLVAGHAVLSDREGQRP
jgi:hypothetical protein